MSQHLVTTKNLEVWTSVDDCEACHSHGPVAEINTTEAAGEYKSATLCYECLSGILAKFLKRIEGI